MMKRLKGRPAWWRDLWMCLDLQANYKSGFYVGSAAKLADALYDRFGHRYTEHAVRKVLVAFVKLGLVVRHGEHNVKAGVLKVYLVRSFQLGLVELMAHVKAMCIRVAYQGRLIGKAGAQADPRIRVAGQEITDEPKVLKTEPRSAVPASAAWVEPEEMKAKRLLRMGFRPQTA